MKGGGTLKLAAPAATTLPAGMTAVEAFRRLAGLPHAVFFDSAAQSSEYGRYSFVAADPFAWIERTDVDEDPLAEVARFAAGFPSATAPGLPPFQGGVAGLFGYELGRTLERVPRARIDDLPTPPLAVGAYDVVLAFDHAVDRGWIVSQGFPETSEPARLERATKRIAQFQAWLARPPVVDAYSAADGTALKAPTHKVGFPGVDSNMSADEYRRMVLRAVEYIHAGDLFQANLSQRLTARARTSAVELYLRLRERNPAPYAGFLDGGDWQVASASPECFLTVREGRVETRPIKGTRGRLAHAVADLFSGDELRASSKDRAENVMIVDLMRNDLSRVCRTDSVHVAQLCRLESYAFVQHLVSVVRGELRHRLTPFDLLRAAFPGGSVTGAPKLRAMEVIAELEPTARGPYCGSLGYIGFDGTMDSNILIRTITAAHGWLQFPVGGGIVSPSDADDEYRETWHKARGLIEAAVG